MLIALLMDMSTAQLCNVQAQLSESYMLDPGRWIVSFAKNLSLNSTKKYYESVGKIAKYV